MVLDGAKEQLDLPNLELVSATNADKVVKAFQKSGFDHVLWVQV